MLSDLSKKWLSLEIDHRCSKTASDQFWKLAKEAFPKLYRAKVNDNVYQDIPQFTSQRRRLYNNHVPPVKLEIGYENKGTKERVVVKGSKTPVSRFNPREFDKLYEVATVEVITSIHFQLSKKNSFMDVYFPIIYFHAT